MKEVNRSSGPVSIESFDDSPDPNQNGFFDSKNPELAPPKDNAMQKKKPWKRKLIGWCFILLIIAAGVFADGVGFVFALCGTDDSFKGKSSTNKVCVGLARVCCTCIEGVAIVCCVPVLFA